jgi:tetratricopeptide (TPR) repeat protein
MTYQDQVYTTVRFVKETRSYGDREPTAAEMADAEARAGLEPVVPDLPGDYRVIDFDGTRLFTAEQSDGQTLLRVWDARTGKPLTARLAHQGDLAAVHVSQNGRVLATATVDDVLRIWNLESSLPAGPPLFQIPRQGIRTLRLSFDGRRLAVERGATFMFSGSYDDYAPAPPAGVDTPPPPSVDSDARPAPVPDDVVYDEFSNSGGEPIDARYPRSQNRSYADDPPAGPLLIYALNDTWNGTVQKGRLFAETISGRQPGLQGELQPLRTNVIAEAWERLQLLKHPEGISSLAKWHRAKSEFLLSTGLLSVGLEHADRAITHGETGAEIYATKGALHAELGQSSEALEALQRAADLHSEEVDVYAYLAMLHLVDGDLKAYRKQCAQAVRRISADSTKDDLATAVFVCVAHPKAIKDYQSLIDRCQRTDLKPSQQGDPLLLGALYFRAGNYRAAVEQLELGIQQSMLGPQMGTPAADGENGEEIAPVPAVTPFTFGYSGSLYGGLPDAWIFLAMSYARAEDMPAAQHWLAQAELWLDEYRRQSQQSENALNMIPRTFTQFLEQIYTEARDMIPPGTADDDRFAPPPEPEVAPVP